MNLKLWLENKTVQWQVPWPNRKGTGDEPHAFDTPPELIQGDYILYHGTNMPYAKSILEQRRVTKDDWGKVGICATPKAAGIYAAMKASAKDNIPSVVLRMVIDKKWFLSQEVTREGGGSGKDQWLIESEEIPPNAIKVIGIYSVWGERQ